MKARAADPPPTDLSVGDFVVLRSSPRLLTDRKDGSMDPPPPVWYHTPIHACFVLLRGRATARCTLIICQESRTLAVYVSG